MPRGDRPCPMPAPSVYVADGHAHADLGNWNTVCRTFYDAAAFNTYT